MGLIRNAAIVAVAITLIPADPEDRAYLYSKAHQGVAWTMTFCDRNQNTCAHGHAFKEAFLEKASFAASAAYELAVVHLLDDQDNMRQQPRFVEAIELAPQQPRRTGTLTALDREISWRGQH